MFAAPSWLSSVWGWSQVLYVKQVSWQTTVWACVFNLWSRPEERHRAAQGGSGARAVRQPYAGRPTHRAMVWGTGGGGAGERGRGLGHEAGWCAQKDVWTMFGGGTTHTMSRSLARYPTRVWAWL